MRALKAMGDMLNELTPPGEAGDVAEAGERGKSKASERGVSTSRSKLYMDDLRDLGDAIVDPSLRIDFLLVETLRSRGEGTSTRRPSLFWEGGARESGETVIICSAFICESADRALVRSWAAFCGKDEEGYDGEGGLSVAS
jgi:hypothetical protein